MRSFVALICSAAMTVFATMTPVSCRAEPPPEEIGPTPPRLGLLNRSPASEIPPQAKRMDSRAPLPKRPGI